MSGTSLFTLNIYLSLLKRSTKFYDKNIYQCTVILVHKRNPLLTKNSTGQKVNKHCALYGIHALMTSIKQQEVFEDRYVRGSEERCRILKACHVDLTPGHMGGKRTSHRDLEGFFGKGVIKDIESKVSVE